MTVQLLNDYRIECDVRATAFCEEKLVTQDVATLDIALEQAVKLGWTISPDGDRCPPCINYLAQEGVAKKRLGDHEKLTKDMFDNWHDDPSTLASRLINIGWKRD